MAVKVQFKQNKDNTFVKEEYTNLFLDKGEPFFDSTQQKLYVGDGESPLSSLGAINEISGEKIAENLTGDIVIEKINDDATTDKIFAKRIQGLEEITVGMAQTAQVAKTVEKIIKVSDDPNTVAFQIGEDGPIFTHTITTTKGDSAGFGTPTASTNTISEYSPASVSVEADPESPDTAKVFNFTFNIPRGQGLHAKANEQECQSIGDFYIDSEGWFKVLVGVNLGEKQFEIAGNTRGPQGIQGNPGQDGQPGANGSSSYITNIQKVGDTTHITFEDATGTHDVQIQDGATGSAGPAGEDGVTPLFRVNSESNHWEVSYDVGITWSDTGINATGAQGLPGQDGQDGRNGRDGTDGQDGISITSITEERSTESGGENIITITLSDGTTKKLSVYNGSKGESGIGTHMYFQNEYPTDASKGDLWYVNGNADVIHDDITYIHGKTYCYTGTTTLSWQLCEDKIVSATLSDLENTVESIQTTLVHKATAYFTEIPPDTVEPPFDVKNEDLWYCTDSTQVIGGSVPPASPFEGQYWWCGQTSEDGIYTIDTWYRFSGSAWVESVPTYIQNNWYQYKDGQWIAETDPRLHTYISQIAQTTKSITLTVDDLGESVGELEIRAGAIETRVRTAEGNISAVEQTAERISQKVENAEGEIARVDLKADGISSTVSTLSGNVSEIRQDVDSISTKVESIKGDVSEIDQKADAIKLRVENAEGDISTLTTTASKIGARVTDAEGNISSLTVTSENLTTRVGTTEGQITTLTQTSKSISQRVTTAEGNITTVTTTANGTATEIADARGASASLKAELNRISSSIHNGINTYKQTEEPSNPVAGDIWIYVNDDQIFSETVPENPKNGDLWYCEKDIKGSGEVIYSFWHWYKWNGSNWIETGAPDKINGEYYRYNDSTWELVQDSSSIVKSRDSLISQTADEIVLKASQTDLDDEITKTAQLKLTVEGIDSTVSNHTEAITSHQTLIKQNADAITLKASQTDLDGVDQKVSEVKITADGVSAEVQSARGDSASLKLELDRISSAIHHDIINTYSQKDEPQDPITGDIWYYKDDNQIVSATEPENPSVGNLWYCTETIEDESGVKKYQYWQWYRWNGTSWEQVGAPSKIDGDLFRYNGSDWEPIVDSSKIIKSHDTLISQTADEIVLKASKEALDGEIQARSELSVSVEGINTIVSGHTDALGEHTTQIKQNADQIELKASQSDLTSATARIGTLEGGVQGLQTTVSDHTNTLEEHDSSITQTATAIATEIKAREESEEAINANVSRINQSVSSISSTVSSHTESIETLDDDVGDLKTTVDDHESRIDQTADAITAEVARAINAEDGKINTSGYLTKTGYRWNLTDSSFTVDSKNGNNWNTVMTVDDDGLQINGSGTFTGTIHASAGEFEGTITAGEGSKIGDFTIADNNLIYDASNESQGALVIRHWQDPPTGDRYIVRSSTFSPSGITLTYPSYSGLPGYRDEVTRYENGVISYTSERSDITQPFKIRTGRLEVGNYVGAGNHSVAIGVDDGQSYVQSDVLTAGSAQITTIVSGSGSYGETLPATGVDGQIFFKI